MKYNHGLWNSLKVKIFIFNSDSDPPLSHTMWSLIALHCQSPYKMDL